MIDNFPEAPESVALALLVLIEAAKNKRRRGNQSEKERLLSLYKDCLSAVTGTEREALHTLH